MKSPRNFEALFLVTTVLCTSLAGAASVLQTRVAPVQESAVVSDAPVQVVVVKAKRLSAAQKAALA
jgi:hypothetical protein